MQLAEIISIGDEILIGDIVNTNATWLASELSKIGVKTQQVTTITDSREHIIKTFSEAGKRSNIVISTGGLGPTCDDITKKTLAELFSTSLVQSSQAIEDIENLLGGLNPDLIKINIGSSIHLRS